MGFVRHTIRIHDEAPDGRNVALKFLSDCWRAQLSKEEFLHQNFSMPNIFHDKGCSFHRSSSHLGYPSQQEGLHQQEKLANNVVKQVAPAKQHLPLHSSPKASALGSLVHTGSPLMRRVWCGVHSVSWHTRTYAHTHAWTYARTHTHTFHSAVLH